MKESSKSKALFIQKLLASLVHQNGKYKDNNEGVIYLKLLSKQLEVGENNDTRQV